jgi:diguanylate cyclase (GGDEF)-like protein
MPWRPSATLQPQVLVVGCLAWFAVGTLLRPTGGGSFLYDVGLYNAICLGAALMCWKAGNRTGSERSAWRWLAASLAVNALGNVLYTLIVAVAEKPPYPSVADFLYLLSYALQYVTLVQIMRARAPRFHPSMWLDGLIGALGAGALAIAFLLGPTLHMGEGGLAAALTGLAYPVADLLLLSLLVGIAAALSLRVDVSMLLLVVSFVANLAGDIIYLNLAARGTYVEGGPLDLTWLVGAATAGFAAQAAQRRRADGPPARSRTSPTGARPEDAARVGWRVIAIPTLCALASLVLLGVGWGDRMPVAAAWLASACIMVTLLRTAVTFSELRTLREARRQAHTDELTGLPNRRDLLDHAAQELRLATPARPLALLLMDLNGFKQVNDGLGHHAGDELLQLIGPRLRRALLPGQLLARLGGDEFAVLLPGFDELAAHGVAVELLRELEEPFVVEGIRLRVGASIGVAVGPATAATVAELLRCADVAMYAAKVSRTGAQVYSADESGPIVDRLRLMEDLHVALAQGQLVVHLQPQVALADGRVVGAEALVRWPHPVRGLMHPSELLPAAEQAGLLLPLADTVLDLALSAVALWWAEGVHVPVSVNLAAANVTDLDLPSKVSAALARRGLPAAALTLEVVEDTLMADPDRASQVLGEIRASGVSTSLDDFGTGYSSLSYLRNLPMDELKLDRAFTQDLLHDSRARAIVEHTVSLAHALGLRLVAEGIEDDVTGAALADLGCDVAQGFAIARPMPVEAFLRWLAQEGLGRTGGSSGLVAAGAALDQPAADSARRRRLAIAPATSSAP